MTSPPLLPHQTIVGMDGKPTRQMVEIIQRLSRALATAETAYGVLEADYTLTSTTNAQKLFNWSTNGALTLAAGRYSFACLLHIDTMSATSNNARFGVVGGGTATVSGVLYQVSGVDSSTPTATVTLTGSTSATADSNGNMVSAATGTGLSARIAGGFTVTEAGTIVPSIQLANAAAAVVKAGSYFECARIGDGATNGAWG